MKVAPVYHYFLAPLTIQVLVPTFSAASVVATAVPSFYNLVRNSYFVVFP